MSRIALYLADPRACAAGLIASVQSARAAGHRIVTVASEHSGSLRGKRVLRKLEARLKSGEFALIVAVPAALAAQESGRPSNVAPSATAGR